MSRPRNIDERLLDINGCMRDAAQESIPRQTLKKQRPWISSTTLALLEERNLYRANNDVINEKLTAALIRRQVRDDRQSWLNAMLEDGN